MQKRKFTKQDKRLQVIKLCVCVIGFLELIALCKNIDGIALAGSFSGIVGIASFYFGKWKGHKESD